VSEKTVIESKQDRGPSGLQEVLAKRGVPIADPAPYVGTPAVGTSKAAVAAGVLSTRPSHTLVDKRRRRFVWSCVVGFLGAWLIAFFSVLSASGPV
jgi:hypothetical protein